jgi:AcrR family transcriptional regulator
LVDILLFVDKAALSRRDELLDLAATMFADRGLRATTVRDIADSAGILSGSLYHHFSSKEEMVDELLRGFLDWLFERYQQIVATEPNPLERLKGLFLASFEAIEHRHAQVVIYQDEAKRLSGQPRFSYVEERNKEQRKMWLDLLNQGVEEGYPARYRCRPGVPVHPRHHLFRCAGTSRADR